MKEPIVKKAAPNAVKGYDSDEPKGDPYKSLQQLSRKRKNVRKLESDEDDEDSEP